MSKSMSIYFIKVIFLSIFTISLSSCLTISKEDSSDSWCENKKVKKITSLEAELDHKMQLFREHSANLNEMRNIYKKVGTDLQNAENEVRNEAYPLNEYQKDLEIQLLIIDKKLRLIHELRKRVYDPSSFGSQ